MKRFRLGAVLRPKGNVHHFSRCVLFSQPQPRTAIVILTGNVEMHALYVRDAHSVDGDIATLISGIGSWDVALRNDKIRLIEPVENGSLRMRG